MDTHPPGSTPTVRLLRVDDVVALTGMRRSTVYLRVSQGTFPRPRQLSRQSVAWRSDEVQAWIEHLPVAGSPSGAGR